MTDWLLNDAAPASLAQDFEEEAAPGDWQLNASAPASLAQEFAAPAEPWRSFDWLVGLGFVETAIVGTLIATDAADGPAFTGGIAAAGSLSALDATDVPAAAGGIAVAGDLAAADVGDLPAIAGAIAAAGSLSAIDAIDDAALLGAVIADGSLSAIDATDDAAFVGAAAAVSQMVGFARALLRRPFRRRAVVSGRIEATDQPDLASFAGEVINAGTLAVREGTDTIALVGEVRAAWAQYDNDLLAIAA